MTGSGTNMGNLKALRATNFIYKTKACKGVEGEGINMQLLAPRYSAVISLLSDTRGHT